MGKALSLQENIWLALKNFTMTNTTAYFSRAPVMQKESGPVRYAIINSVP